MENQPEEAKVVEAAVVPATQVPAVVKREPHKFVPTKFGTSARMVSIREGQLLEAFFKCWNIRDAAKEIGVSYSTAKTYLRKPHIVALVDAAKERIANARDLTIDKLAAKISSGLDGAALTPTQIDCMKLSQKLLKPETRGGVNVQVNTQVNIASPYNDIPLETMAKEFQERADAIKSESTDGPRTS